MSNYQVNNKVHLRNPYKISEFFFGENDGEKEAMYHKDFIKYFYTGKGYHEKLKNIKYWLVLGRKGTGKSILGWYFHEVLKQDNEKFSEVVSYRDFRYNKLLELEDGDIKPNQYISIWKFILFIYLGKLLLQNKKLFGKVNFERLKAFIENNFSLKIDKNIILEVAINKKVKGEFLGIGGEGIKQIRYEKGSYLNYIDELEQIIISLIRESGADYFLILDDLDDRFRRNENNKDALISLIKAINYINIQFIKKGFSSKVITLLRTDIFSYLNDPDLNKIKSDNGIVINWGNTVSKHSELFKMLIHKIKESKEDLKQYNYIDLFTMLFPQKIGSISPEKFFLERTFFRPRDIIAYIKLIVDRYSNTRYIGYKAFQDLEREYSNYLFNEIENELIGHFEDEYIKEAFLLLKQYKKNKFFYSEIKEYLNNNKNRYSHITNIDQLLKVFFDFGVLGNSWKNEGRIFYTSIIRDDRAEVDFDKEFILHLGLRKSILY